jgi:hypothetical protein
MSQIQPNISADEPEKFAFEVGKILQNAGTTEYLINQILEKIIHDRLILSHIVHLPVSKRLEVLDGLVSRDRAAIESTGISLSELFASAKTTFQNRNQIAHNPLIVKEVKSGEVTSLVKGIHVIRYAEKGNSEDWIDYTKLEAFTLKSHILSLQFNKLLNYYNKNK